MRIRRAEPSEYDALAKVMFDAIHSEPSPYTQAERDAWAPEQRRGAEWALRIDGQSIWVADDGSDILGFITLKDTYVDFAYILQRARGTGAFRALYETLEDSARQADAPRLWVHASLAAQPAFAAMGFRVVQHEEIEQRGERLRRAEMEKILEQSDDA